MSNESAAPLIHGRSASSIMSASENEIVTAAGQIIASGIEHIALVSIQLCYPDGDALNAHQIRYAENTTLYLLLDLRPRVRKTDSVFQVGHTLYFLLHGANK